MQESTQWQVLWVAEGSKLEEEWQVGSGAEQRPREKCRVQNAALGWNNESAESGSDQWGEGNM